MNMKVLNTSVATNFTPIQLQSDTQGTIKYAPLTSIDCVRLPDTQPIKWLTNIESYIPTTQEITYAAVKITYRDQQNWNEDQTLIIKGEKGDPGIQGPQGPKGDTGVPPEITVSPDGYWIINGQKTDIEANALGYVEIL